MSKRLSQKRLDELFRAFCERQSVNYVYKKCQVSPITVRKYRKLENWDERIKDIQAKARAKADDKVADHLAKNLKYVEFAKGKILNLLKQMNLLNSANPISDLDKMIRLELLLRGEADSRTEVKDTGLKDKTTEELIAMKKELEGKK